VIDFTKPVRTIGTKEPVKIISLDGREPYSVLGYIGESVDIKSWTIDGLYLVVGGVSDLLNLENIPQKRSGWVNIFADYPPNMTDKRRVSNEYIYPTKAGAESHGRGYGDYVTTAYIEWEE